MNLSNNQAAMIEVSTAHLTAADNEILGFAGWRRATELRNNNERHDPNDFPVASDPTGFYFKLPENPSSPLPTHSLSEPVTRLLNEARAQGIRLVYFHRDGTPVEGLPTHDW